MATTPTDTCVNDCPEPTWCPGCAACPCVATCDPGCSVNTRPAPVTVSAADVRAARSWDIR